MNIHNSSLVCLLLHAFGILSKKKHQFPSQVVYYNYRARQHPHAYSLNWELLLGRFWWSKLKTTRVSIVFTRKSIKKLVRRRRRINYIRRYKYYMVLLKLRRATRLRRTRRGWNWKNVKPKTRRLLKQFFLIRRYGYKYKKKRRFLRRQFASSHSSYDHFWSRRLKRALIFLVKRRRWAKKIVKKYSIRTPYFRPYYRVRRRKLVKKLRVVRAAIPRQKRFLRQGGSTEFAINYAAVLRRWILLWQKKTKTKISMSKYTTIISSNKYFGMLKSGLDLAFLKNVYHLFYKRKRSNFFLTLTNGFGEVIVTCSCGKYLKFKRNRKMRNSLYNLPGVTKLFLQAVVRKKIGVIDNLYRPVGFTKRSIKTIVMLFGNAGVVIKNVIKNSKMPHATYKKTKKHRRL